MSSEGKRQDGDMPPEQLAALDELVATLNEAGQELVCPIHGDCPVVTMRVLPDGVANFNVEGCCEPFCQHAMREFRAAMGPELFWVADASRPA